MRIHSKTKDYYDVIQRTNLEPHPAYIRDNTIGLICHDDKKRIQDLGMIHEARESAPIPPVGHGVGLQVLGFCGKIHVVYIFKDHCFTSLPDLHAHLLKTQPNDPNKLHEYPWNSTSERLTSRNIVQLLKQLEEEHSRDHFSSKRAAFTLAGWSRFTQETGRKLQANHDDLFRQIRAPVFLYRSKNTKEAQLDPRHGRILERNPVLINIGWQRHMPPFEAWQRIDQYLGNEMAIQRDPEPLSDELRRDSHGFNDRSFKNDAPSHKKLRRKSNRKRKSQKTVGEATKA